MHRSTRPRRFQDYQIAIAIGCNEADFKLKELPKHVLVNWESVVERFGNHNAKPVIYADIAPAAVI